MRPFAFFLLLVALFALATSVVSDAFPDSSVSLRKLLATEQVCKDNVNDFNPGKVRTLNSKKCRGDEVLKRCRCKSPTNKIKSVAEAVTKEGYCKCTFTNEAPNKRFDVFYEACAVCEKNNDECQRNADCTDYDKPICDSDLSPKKCVQCKRNSQCSAGESCVSNKCVQTP